MSFNNYQIYQQNLYNHLKEIGFYISINDKVNKTNYSKNIEALDKIISVQNYYFDYYVWNGAFNKYP